MMDAIRREERNAYPSGLDDCVVLGGGTLFGNLFSTNSNLWLDVALDLSKNGTFGARWNLSPMWE
jgi:hypothetical protein